MTTVFTILIVFSAILLILVVLVQKSKGGGLASGFSSNNAILGVKKTTDSIEKATWILASIIIVLSIVTVTIAPQVTRKSAVDAPVQQQSAPDFGGNAPLFPMPEEGGNE